MRTRTFRLTEPEANELQAAYLHAQEADTKTRYQAVRLYGLGYDVAQVCDICACGRRSLLNWTRAYRERGLARLTDQLASHLRPAAHNDGGRQWALPFLPSDS